MLTVRIGTRWWVAAMIFACVFFNYMMRVNLSVNIVSMSPAPIYSNDTDIDSSQDVPTLGWSTYENGLVLSSYFWGYVAANVIGGPVADQYGPRRVILITSLLSVILTILSPPAAKLSYKAMVITRIALGFCGGFTGPALQGLISHWAVSDEKNRFVGLFQSGTIGTVLTWSLCGIIIEGMGWEWAFYFFGIMTLIFCVLFYFIVFDSPNEHTWISKSEKQFILDGTTVDDHNKAKTPYFKIVSSVPIWALTIAYCGSGWGNYFVLTAAPTFISNVLGVNVAITGFLSSGVYITKCLGAMGFGCVGDFLLSRKIISLRVLRKSFIIFSHIIPACLLLSLTLINDSFTAVCLVTITMAFHSCQTITISGNCHDLAPNFAASAFGLPNAGSSLGGIYTPLIVAFFTKGNERSFEAWQPVFYTGACVYIVTGLIFIMFGSTEIQPWNNIEPRKDAENVK